MGAGLFGRKFSHVPQNSITELATPWMVGEIRKYTITRHGWGYLSVNYDTWVIEGLYQPDGFYDYSVYDRVLDSWYRTFMLPGDDFLTSDFWGGA